MLWFYTRDRDSLSLETRYDNERLEYLGILTYPDGRQETSRFSTAARFREWLVTLDEKLIARRWVQDGPPEIVADGWPHKTPPR